MELMTAVNLLNINGIPATEQTVTKNGTSFQAVMLGTGPVTPVLYPDTFAGVNSATDMLDLARNALKSVPDLDIKGIFTKEFFLTHVRSCVCHATNEPETVSHPVYGDLEEYYRVFMGELVPDNLSTIKVLKSHLETLDINEDELHKAARRNLRENAWVISMQEMLAELTGAEPVYADVQMYVATTRDKTYGAGVMLLEDLLDDFCMEHGFSSLYIIPSSLHEVLLINAADISMEEVNGMICSVNDEVIEDDIVLSDHAYRYPIGEEPLRAVDNEEAARRSEDPEIAIL